MTDDREGRRLWSILARCQEGAEPEEDEINLALSLLHHEDPQVSTHACVIALRWSQSEDLESRVLHRLEELCGQPPDPAYGLQILLLMLHVPVDRITPGLRRFVERCSRSMEERHEGLRGNAVLVLLRLAQEGDRKARRRIQDMAGDEDANVRYNVRMALDLLKPGN